MLSVLLLTLAGAGLVVALAAPGLPGVIGAAVAAVSACCGVTTEVARDWWGRP